MKVRRTLAAVLSVAMVVVSQIGLTSVAEAKAYDSKVTIDYVDGHFVGKVTSGSGECEVKRLVKIFKRTGDGKVLVGQDRTNQRGRYDVDLMTAQGKHFARAARSEPMADTICRRDDSRTITV